MLRTHYSKDVFDEKDGKKVKLAGWARKIRSLGSIKFILLADKFDIVQVTAKKGDVKEDVIKKISSLTREDVIVVSGKVKENKKAPGGKEIIPEEIEIIAKSKSPLPLETDPRIESELDTRIDYRFLDLRNPKVRAIFRIKDVIQRSFIRYFEQHGFLLMNTPVIVAAATEGGTELFPISYFEKEAFLGQSPQLYKQMVMASGIDKVLIVTPIFRAEKHNTPRHLNESTQMDIEVAFVENEEDVLKYMEGVVHYIYTEIKKHCKEELDILERKIVIPKLPVKRMTYDECIELLKKDGIKMKWGEDFTPEAEKMLSKHYDPLIITKWPTKVRGFYSMPEPGNEKICRAYDMLLHGMEVCSGAQRVHDYKQLVKIMKQRKMNPNNFKFYLDAFKYGMPPHAGWSFGLERLTMVVTGVKNIRECVLYPRDRKRVTP